jgi:hypothetical protein
MSVAGPLQFPMGMEDINRRGSRGEEEYQQVVISLKWAL